MAGRRLLATCWQQVSGPASVVASGALLVRRSQPNLFLRRRSVISQAARHRPILLGVTARRHKRTVVRRRAGKRGSKNVGDGSGV
jgi:hypothetical protein